MPKADSNLDVVARFDALFGASDLSALDELCTPGMVNHTLDPSRPAGLAGTRQFLATQAHALGDNGWSWLNVISEGDFVVQFGARGGHWGGGRLLGLDVPPGDYERGIAVMFRLEAGRIAERWAVRDDLTMMRQLGAVPAP